MLSRDVRLFIIAALAPALLMVTGMELIKTELDLVCGGNRTPANAPNGDPAEYQRAYNHRQQEYFRMLPEPAKNPQQFVPTPGNWG